ncbi:hypothetical protein ACFWXA_14190 [Streptomyces atroolivaceus]|uniref:hypothetical protein n=1 Tax=Streptomyces atroolivaceus TaxID=66869 RepID=UPI00365074AF
MIIDEHPLRGPAAALLDPVAEALIRLRHRRVPARSARLVERTTAQPRRSGPGEGRAAA